MGLEGLLKHFTTLGLQVSLEVTRCLVKSLAALAVPDPLRRQRWVPASPGGQHADRWRDGLEQQAKRNDQQGEACAGGVDVGLEPGFLSHLISLALAWNRVPSDALRKRRILMVTSVGRQRISW